MAPQVGSTIWPSATASRRSSVPPTKMPGSGATSNARPTKTMPSSSPQGDFEFGEFLLRWGHCSSVSSSRSSSGVQIVGISYPARLHSTAIRLEIRALARCLQFHVIRYCTSWTVATAMCAASRIALVGNPPRPHDRFGEFLGFSSYR